MVGGKQLLFAMNLDSVQAGNLFGVLDRAGILVQESIKSVINLHTTNDNII